MADTTFSDVTGTPIVAAWLNDVNDTVYGLPSTASTSTGAGLIQFDQTLNYVANTLGAYLNERVSVKSYPWLAKGDSDGTTTGNGTDDTAAIQACLTWAVSNGYTVFIPNGCYRTTSALNITAGITIEGVGTSPYATAIGTRGEGSWFFLDHSGKGFNIRGASGVIHSTAVLRSIGTCRVQPTPSATPSTAWTPTTYDYDIYIENFDVLLDDVMLLNPSHGVQLDNGHAGRLRTRYLRGQPFVVGVDIIYAADVCVFEATHWWPFWRDNSNVHDYTRITRVDMQFGRCDNPQVSNFFSYGALAGFKFVQNSDGRCQNFRFTNLNIDSCQIALWVDVSVVDGVNGQIANLNHQGTTTLSTSKMIVISGDLSTIDFSLLSTNRCGQRGISCDGTGNTLTIHGLRIANWNTSGAGWDAVYASAGNIIRIEGYPTIIGGGAGAKYSTTGVIYVDEWRSFTSTYSAGSGTITTMGTANNKYKLFGDSVKYIVDATITTNGTGATNFRATLPVIQLAGTPNTTGHGREAVNGGKALTALLAAGSSTLVIQNYDNTYPGADGARICVQGEYQVA